MTQLSPTVAKCRTFRSEMGVSDPIRPTVANCRPTVAQVRSCGLSGWFYALYINARRKVSHESATVGDTFGDTSRNVSGTSPAATLIFVEQGGRNGVLGVGEGGPLKGGPLTTEPFPIAGGVR